MTLLNAAVGLDWTTILVTLVTVLGGTGAYNFYKRYMDSKDKDKDATQADGVAFRKTLLKRITELEERESKNNANILKLTQTNATLSQKVQHLEEENKRLLSRLVDLSN